MKNFISPVKVSLQSSTSHYTNGYGSENSLQSAGVSYGVKFLHENVFELMTKRYDAGGNKIRAATSLLVGAPITGLGVPVVFGAALMLTAITVGIRIVIGLPLAFATGAIGGLCALISNGDVIKTAKRAAADANIVVAALVGVPAHLALYAVQIAVSAVEVVGYTTGWAVGAVVGLPWAIAG